MTGCSTVHHGHYAAVLTVATVGEEYDLNDEKVMGKIKVFIGLSSQGLRQNR